jgi:HipA-like kinase
MGTARVDTDLGEGYLKALGNPEGPHGLACELVGSMLADWLGLSTLDFSLVEVNGEDEIPFLKSGKASPGPAFISRTEKGGFPWGGTAKELKQISNPSGISGLVTLDTWILNCDRHSPDGSRRNLDNVFLVQQPGRSSSVLLKAIDHTHAFTCGGEISRRIGFIERIQDIKIYGLFSEFRVYLDHEQVKILVTKLGRFTREVAEEFIGIVPAAWDVNRDSRSAWARFITERAHFLADHLEQILWPQREFGEGN